MTDSATQAPRPASAAPGAGAASGAGTGAGPAIRTEDLRKTYKTARGDVPAVRGIDLNVPTGELFGPVWTQLRDEVQAARTDGPPR